MDKDGKNVTEITLAEDIARMNLNEATNRNNQDPRFAQYLGKYSPRWAKRLFVIVLAFILVGIIAGLIAALMNLI